MTWLRRLEKSFSPGPHVFSPSPESSYPISHHSIPPPSFFFTATIASPLYFVLYFVATVGACLAAPMLAAAAARIAPRLVGRASLPAPRRGSARMATTGSAVTPLASLFLV